MEVQQFSSYIVRVFLYILEGMPSEKLKKEEARTQKLLPLDDREDGYMHSRGGERTEAVERVFLIALGSSGE